MRWTDALKVGLVQCLAMIPGTSRSGATIIGGMFLGLSRKAATDFSFYLAIPTLIGAGVYSLYKERAALAALVPTIPETVTYGPNNSGRAMAALALAELDGRLALATGRFDKAIALLEAAVAQQDALSYDDPPAWYHPVRETLGAALLIAGRAKAAARVFRADLERHPGNGRSLWGLWQSLEASGRSKAADETRAEYEKAWRVADIRLKLGDY